MIIQNQSNDLIQHDTNSNHKNIFQLLNYIYLLKRTKRSGWQLKGILDGESVADHSFGVALTILFLIQENIFTKLDMNR